MLEHQSECVRHENRGFERIPSNVMVRVQTRVRINAAFKDAAEKTRHGGVSDVVYAFIRTTPSSTIRLQEPPNLN